MAKVRRSFRFAGRIPPSKSILNRLLVIQSYELGLRILNPFDSAFAVTTETADDVLKMKSGLAQLLSGQNCDCGAAGTTFRFLALRASRIKGRHYLFGSPQLMLRPQGPLVELLEQLGCEAKLDAGGIEIMSEGWKIPPAGITVDRGISSQFASAVLLNCWNLPEELKINFVGEAVSTSYLEMTLSLLKQTGLQFLTHDNRITVSARSQVQPQDIKAELDVSSAFSIAALAAVSQGQSIFECWPEKSMQPDVVFLKILEKMGCSVRMSGESLIINGREELKPVNVDLSGAPDLFPVLAVLCSFAKGKSSLFGAPHLVHKESNRIQKTTELLRIFSRNAETGICIEPRNDGMDIEGSGWVFPIDSVQSFDPGDDHRLAMAAAVACWAGIKINVLNKVCVDKSFPEFWKYATEHSSPGAHLNAMGGE